MSSMYLLAFEWMVWERLKLVQPYSIHQLINKLGDDSLYISSKFYSFWYFDVGLLEARVKMIAGATRDVPQTIWLLEAILYIVWKDYAMWKWLRIIAVACSSCFLMLLVFGFLMRAVCIWVPIGPSIASLRNCCTQLLERIYMCWRYL